MKLLLRTAAVAIPSAAALSILFVAPVMGEHIAVTPAESVRGQVHM